MKMQMKAIFKSIAAIFGILLAGCATPSHPPAGPSPKTGIPAPVQAAPAGVPRQVIIFIPQTDQAAGSWIKLLDKFPQLKMAVAVSPRFSRFSKEPALKDRLLALQKDGRLELALQLRIARFLPLLNNTDAARAALPAGSPLPVPAFAFPEDAVQIVAKAKSDFTKFWGLPPKGLILPQGAVNSDLLKLLNQRGLSWVVGALSAPAVDGAYRAGSLAVFDATPQQEQPHFTVQVLDERQTGNPAQSVQMLTAWAQGLSKNNVMAVLPADPLIPAQDLPATGWGNRAWTSRDWSPWIGSAHKNAAWTWLRETRQALETFKNSGQASVRRLDMAFEELFNAENANFFSGMTEGETTFTASEDREREFKATLSSVFRLIGQAPPDNLFASEGSLPMFALGLSSTTVSGTTLPDNRRQVLIQDAPGDDHGDGQLNLAAAPAGRPGVYDLQAVEVIASSETLDWTITLGALDGASLGNYQKAGPLIDIYIDLNAQSGVGTLPFLPGRSAVAGGTDAWEYALALWGSQGQFYRTRGSESSELAESVPLSFQGNRVRFSIPRGWLRGNPLRWGYQVLVMSYDPKSLESEARPLMTPDMAVAHRLPIFDLIDPFDLPQAQLLTDIEAGKRNDIPFVRVSGAK
jgi:hypothetical protein